MANPVSVKWFTSTMSGAPGLSANLLGVLDACLVNGFGSVTLDSLVVSGGVATATKSAGHNFLDHTVILIADATPAGLNGEKRIVRVSNTVFTFDATGISNQTATGTITAKMAPAGWTQEFTGTNKAVYARSGAATAMRLRVNQANSATYASLLMYESMTDVDTGSGASATYYAYQGNTQWLLLADSRLLYFFSNGTLSGGLWYGGFSFGDIDSYRPIDAYGCWLLARTDQNTGLNLGVLTTSSGVLCRGYSQAGGNIASTCYSGGKTDNGGYTGRGSGAYPSPIDNGFHAWPIEVWETDGARGILPGVWNSKHTAGAVPQATIIDGFPEAGGKRLRVDYLNNGYSSVALDLTGPWRSS